MIRRGLLALSLGLLPITLPAAAQDPIAWRAEAAEADGDYVRAWTLYSQAAVLDPQDRKSAAKAGSLRSLALERAKVIEGPKPFDAFAIDPAIVQAISAEELASLERLKPPAELAWKPGRFTFLESGPARDVIDRVLLTCGVRTVYDSEFSPVQPVRLRLDDATCAEAHSAVAHLTGSFLVPISPSLAMVARETPERRRELEPVEAVTVPLPEPVTVQEAQEAARGVQQLFEIRRFAVDANRRIALIRDVHSKVLPARLLFEQLLLHRPQVQIDIEFIELTRQRDLNFGTDLPTMTQIANFGGLWNAQPSLMPQFTRFLTFGRGLSLFGIGVTGARAFASLTDSRLRNKQEATLRSLDNQAATLHIGDRFPILVSGFFGNIGTVPPDQTVFRPPPQVQFEDLGLTLKITPRVHGSDEVTLTIESEFKVLTGETNNDIPVISNRKFQGQVRLRAGEWAIAAGLTTKLRTENFAGIAGLSQIPGLGLLLRNNSRTKSDSEVILVLKPTILHGGPADAMPRELWVGSETRPAPGL